MFKIKHILENVQKNLINFQKKKKSMYVILQFQLKIKK
jgi:hypothetical protein